MFKCEECDSKLRALGEFCQIRVVDGSMWMGEVSETLYRMKNLFSKLRSLYRVKNLFSNGDMLLLREVTWQNTKCLFINREQKMEM